MKNAQHHKATIRYYLTTTARIVIISKSTVDMEMWRKGNLRALLMGLQIVAVIMENSMVVSQKKIFLIYFIFGGEVTPGC